ncbi:hypothetical protein ACTL6U_08070 [Rhodovibrionaceae bacterium A322]
MVDGWQNNEALNDEDRMTALLAEAEALALYVSRHGNVLTQDQSSLHAGLLEAIGNFRAEQSAGNWAALHGAYRQVTAITYQANQVNGRTILNTQEKVGVLSSFFFFRSARYRPIVIGFLLFIGAMGLELLANWATGINSDSQLNSPLKRLLYAVDLSLMTFLLPAVWGGIGACVFLMKRLSDKLFDQAYESSKVKGDMTRIFLGAMLGVVVVVLFFPEAADVETLGNFTFGPASAAFIAGLSVKPVYAAFEAQSEKLTAYFTRKSEQQGPDQTTSTTRQPAPSSSGGSGTNDSAAQTASPKLDSKDKAAASASSG